MYYGNFLTKIVLSQNLKYDTYSFIRHSIMNEKIEIRYFEEKVLENSNKNL